MQIVTFPTQNIQALPIYIQNPANLSQNIVRPVTIDNQIPNQN